MLAVTVQVQHDVLVKTSAGLDAQLGEPDRRLRVLGVDVEDRGLDHLRHVGAVTGGPRVCRVGGKPNLIVDDDVQGAAGPVAGQVAQI